MERPDTELSQEQAAPTLWRTAGLVGRTDHVDQALVQGGPAFDGTSCLRFVVRIERYLLLPPVPPLPFAVLCVSLFMLIIVGPPSEKRWRWPSRPYHLDRRLFSRNEPHRVVVR